MGHDLHPARSPEGVCCPTARGLQACFLHLRRQRFPSPPRLPSGLRQSFDCFSDTARRSLICRAIGFPSCVVRPTAFAEPCRPPRVRSNRLRGVPSPIRPHLQRISGFRCWGPACPMRTPYGASLCSALVAHLPTSIRRPLAGPPARISSTGKDLVIPIDALVSSVSGSLR